jgi:hypothetical protein
MEIIMMRKRVISAQKGFRCSSRRALRRELRIVQVGCATTADDDLAVDNCCQAFIVTR